MDFKLIDFAVKNNIGIFGICRGIQLINVYFKGTLNQNVENHQNIKTNHKIRIIDGKYNLPEILLVNSYHHQIIDRIGNNLLVFARTNIDNAIEGIYHKSLNIIGVQWHIELINDNYSKQIFNHFISK